MVKGEIVGSWFNSGYHGHFRSKSRNDFICEYRHLAKPQPPKAFVRKLRLPAKTHQFSKHDNKQSFYNDAVIFTEGLGKRRFDDKAIGWKPDMLAWNPRPNQGNGPTPPEFSEYKVTYRGGHRAKPLVQQLVQRPKTSFDEGQPTTTSYRYSHGRDNPNRELLIDAMRNDGLSTAQRSIRPQKFQYSIGRESVATCMNWVTPHEGKKPTVFTPCPSRTCLRTAPVSNESQGLAPASTSQPIMAPIPPTEPKPIPAEPPAPPTQPKEAFSE